MSPIFFSLFQASTGVHFDLDAIGLFEVENDLRQFERMDAEIAKFGVHRYFVAVRLGVRFYLLDNVGCQLIGHYTRSLKFGVPEIGRPKKLHPDKIPMPLGRQAERFPPGYGSGILALGHSTAS